MLLIGMSAKLLKIITACVNSIIIITTSIIIMQCVDIIALGNLVSFCVINVIFILFISIR